MTIPVYFEIKTYVHTESPKKFLSISYKLSISNFNLCLIEAVPAITWDTTSTQTA